jgi:hypothetical protein
MFGAKVAVPDTSTKAQDFSYQTGWSGGKAVDLYFGGIRFESRLGHGQSWLRFFVVFLKLLQVIPFSAISFPIHQLSFGFIKKTTSYRTEKMYLLYIFPLSSTHLWLRCSNFFNPFKKNSFGCVVNRKIGKAKDLSAPLRNLGTESAVTLRAQRKGFSALRFAAQGMTRPQKCFRQADVNSDLGPQCTRKEHREFQFEFLH